MCTKVDLHSHTRGSDGLGTPEQIVQNAVGAGIDVLCLTDHHKTFTPEGQKVARALARAGVRAILGAEYSTAEGHLLIFGVDVQDFDWGFYPSMQRCIDDVNDAGGVAWPAHPFKGYRNVLGDRIFDLRDIPCVEVLNGQLTYQGPRYNALAKKAATKLGLPGVGGSDAHDPRGIGLTYTLFDREVRDTRSLIAELWVGDFRPVVSASERYSCLRWPVRDRKKNWKKEKN